MRFCIAIFALCLFSQGQTVPFPGPGRKPAASGPIYTYQAAESGNCSFTGGDASCATDGSTFVSITVNTVNGDVLVANCVRLNAVGVNGSLVTDVNGETWVPEISLGPNNGATGRSDVSVALIAAGGNGDVITCTRSGGAAVNLALTVDAFRSSTGWGDGGDGTPTDSGTLNYVIATPAGPCSVTASLAMQQDNELVYGSCFATAGTVSSATGYTIAQNDTFTSIGQAFTAYQSFSSITTPSFITNGVLTDPQSLIISFLPN